MGILLSTLSRVLGYWFPVPPAEVVDDVEFEDTSLLQVARAKRSKVQNLRPLQELVFEKIVKTFVNSGVLLPFQDLPLSLRLEILDRMKAEGISRRKQIITPLVKDTIFEMVHSLLDDSIKTFDFALFSTYDEPDKKRDLQVWQLLVEKCPNLEKIVDSRNFPAKTQYGNDPQRRSVKKGENKFQLQDVLPFLLQLPKLQHILLGPYACKEVDMAQISLYFPNLISIFITFNEIVSQYLLDELLALQKLEVVKVNWKFHRDDLSEEEQRNEMDKFFLFRTECLMRFLHLRHSTLYVDGYPSAYVDYNSYPYKDLRMTLSLERLEIRTKFDFSITPFVTHLRLSGDSTPVPPPASFALLTNLRVLSIHGASGSLIAQILTFCGKQLEELELMDDQWDEDDVAVDDVLDICDTLLSCPNLTNFSFMSQRRDDHKQFNTQMNASHIQKMQKFCLDDIRLSHDYASKLMALVLTAPNLEYLRVAPSFSLTPEECEHLHQPLIDGDILQQLKTFKFGSHLEQPAELLEFIMLLPVHSPQLEKLKCFGDLPMLLLFREQILKSRLQRAFDKCGDFRFPSAGSCFGDN
ncbi:uncharacterized protein LOC132197154 [Neocloeon triangulifer]|uniref:uncharacterized protein LOC132197154 n=1 Tax=Neocloeon triangulifer TaxID=2078957 RepID=UPI00286F56FF|nr:uncharacterized protein LOC132197154 [Neocloeon triangulifer]